MSHAHCCGRTWTDGGARRRCQAPVESEGVLAAAAVSYESGLYNAATSDAIVCGIHCKDAICLVVTGRSAAGEAHQMAVAELDRSGLVGAGLSSTVNRLLRMKTKSQYSAESIGAGDAAKAVGWAERMLAAAEAVAAGR